MACNHETDGHGEPLGLSKKTAVVRDRVLLYVRDLPIPPESALELALESLRRASVETSEPDLKTVMDELHQLLKSRGLHPEQALERESRLVSMPPLNRSYMVAEEMDLSLVRRTFRHLKRICRFG